MHALIFIFLHQSDENILAPALHSLHSFNITFINMKAYLLVHAHPLMIVFFICFTARCGKILTFAIQVSITPVFLVFSQFIEPLATKRNIIITSDQTCTKIYQDMNANNDLCCNKNHFTYLLVTNLFECEHRLNQKK
jgi:hypothetical protein